MHSVHAEAALDDVNGSGLCRSEIAGLKLDVDQDVVAPFLMNKRLTFLQCVRHRDDRRQRLEFHFDQRSDIFCLGRRRANHQGDRLADVPDLRLWLRSANRTA